LEFESSTSGLGDGAALTSIAVASLHRGLSPLIACVGVLSSVAVSERPRLIEYPYAVAACMM
jgi:hypothetical protein